VNATLYTTTSFTPVVAGGALASESLAHHFSGNEMKAHGSNLDTTTIVDPSSVTRDASAGITSGIQRAAANSASSSDRLVHFTTSTLTSFSAETLTETSGGSTLITTISVPVVTSTGIHTLPPTNTSVSHQPTKSLASSTKSATSTANSVASPSTKFGVIKVGFIVIITVVSLLAVGICTWLFMRCRRRRSRSRAEKSQKQLEESIHSVTPLGTAHVPAIEKNDTNTILPPSSEELAQPTSNPFETPAEQSAALSDSVIRAPSQNTERQTLQTEVVNVRSQMVALQHSNQEMKDTMDRMMEQVWRLEADVAAEEGSELINARPPTYVSS